MNPDQHRNDDAALGRTFRLTAVAVLIALGLGAAAVFFLRNEPTTLRQAAIATPSPSTPAAPAVKTPEAKFTDITSAAGIKFIHNNGATGEKLLPETMGGGVGFFDYDNDGDQDLLFINSTYWPDKIPAGKKPTTSALYQNDGKGNFKDVTAHAGLNIPIYGMAPAFGDYDNDGFVDIFITAVGKNRLSKNIGAGRFEDVTSTAGVAGAENDWSTAASWFDIDNDGDLDLFVANYVQWTKEIDLQVGSNFPGIGRMYGQPKDFQGTFPYLYRNDGGGKFMDISETSGVQVKNISGEPAAKALGVSPVDIDNDGWMDLIVANDTVPNLLFHNQKDGTFKEIGGRTGVAFDSMGAVRGAMGLDVARYREDEALGIVIGNFANEMNALYVSQPGAQILFTDEAAAEGIGAPSRALLTFGIFFFDYDLDGRQDILSVNGHLDESVATIHKGQQYRQPAQLFWNSGPGSSGSFVPASATHVGADLFKPIVGRGS